MWEETEIAVRRINERMATEASLFQSAAGSILSPKEGGKLFRKLIDSLIGK